jgi:ACS family D-galactonate transporter-like MFS transporter
MAVDAELPPPRSGRARVAVMMFVTVAINYLDRSNLSVAAERLDTDLGLGPVRLGLLFSAFAWTYALFQIPGGWLADRVRPHLLYGSVCALWSMATLAQGLAGTFAFLFGLRLVVGMFEAPSFPICNLLATTWYPEGERGRVIGFYTSGQYVGLAFLTPVLAVALDVLGWRSVFLATGALGLAWALAWWFAYPAPGAVPGSSQPRPAAVSRADLLLLFRHRSLWGVYLGQFCLNAVPWFFLTWFPTYLVRERHLAILQAGFLASLPFLAAFVGVLAGGWSSDYLARSGFSVTVARKAPIVAGLLLSASVLAANFVTRPAWIVFFMALSFFGNGFASITWVMVSLIAPRRLLGLCGGIFNFCGNLAGILVPIVIGLVVRHGGFAPALMLIFFLTLGGVLSYAGLVGPVRRIEEVPRPAGAPGR